MMNGGSRIIDLRPHSAAPPAQADAEEGVAMAEVAPVPEDPIELTDVIDDRPPSRPAP